MRSILSMLLLLCVTLSPVKALAQDLPFAFANQELAARFQHLTRELRCLVCQNQSLADSHAPLAQDLRQEIYDMLVRGDSNEQIITFLTARYGDFVLYRPPFKGTTLLLWLGPVLFLFAGVAIVVTVIRGQSRRQLTPAEQKLADELLADDDNTNRNT